MNINDFNIKSTYVKRVYTRGACIIKSTYVKGINIESAYIKNIFINKTSIIKYLIIYVQLFQILKIELFNID